MHLIVGLGNPGTKYDATRHNVGFRVVRALHTLHIMDFGAWKKKDNAEIAEGRMGNEKVILVMPQTFMNRSGEAIAPLAKYWDVPPANVIIAYDDLDLPNGTVRLRPEGGSGGHNGMKSLIERLGTQAFPRIRIGISGDTRDTVPTDAYVLQRFSAEENGVIENAVARAAEAGAQIVKDGIDAAMNTYNGDEDRA